MAAAGQLPRLLPRLLLLLVAVAAPLASAQTACEMNPTVAACESYTVAEAVLQRDLASLCGSSQLGGATYSGWPAACTLWHECQQGRAAPASCQPLALLQTACNESPMLEACMPYLLMCAPQSVVRQCAQQPPIRQLRSSMQLYTAVQELCAADADLQAGECRSCSAQTFDPDKVTVQALQANCADPLGSLAALCLEEQGLSGSTLGSTAGDQNDTCSTWASFCLSDVGSGFWGLCGGKRNGTAQAPAAAAVPSPSPVAASPPPVQLLQPPSERASAQGQLVPGSSLTGAESVTGTTEAAPPPSPRPATTTPAGSVAAPATCYEDPGLERCRSFQQSDEASVADIQRLCDAMPSMVGCGLWDQCSTGAASGSYCQPFSALGSICLANPATDGCQRWASLCTTAGSVVQQCITAAPIRTVMGTSQTMEAVAQACSLHGASVAGCQQCAAGWRSCTNPLAVLSRLCLASPEISQCSNFEVMCAEAGTTFSSLCGRGTRTIASGIAGNSSSGGSSEVPATASSGGGNSSSEVEAVARMYLHASMSAMILFKSWVPSSGGAYVASCLAIIAIAVVVQALKALNLHLEACWATQLTGADDSVGGGGGFGSLDYGSSPARASLDIKDPRRSSNMPMLRQSMRQSSMTHQQQQHPQQPQRFITRPELARNVVRSALTGAAVLLDYCLMLVVVTFNLGLILSATLGFCLGALAFGHLGERVAAAAAAAAVDVRAPPMAVPRTTSLQPTPENDTDLQYITSHQPLPPHTLGVRIQ